MKKTDINKDIIKRDGAERRKEDIAAHGKPTAFRKTMTKNKKAYTRKEKHKLSLTESDIEKMVEECMKRIKKGGF
jgi:chromatin segregation and condensation protein Rec8/ScpA/Scc1 (kleisin family)